jgi:hypothetical protein
MIFRESVCLGRRRIDAVIIRDFKIAGIFFLEIPHGSNCIKSNTAAILLHALILIAGRLCFKEGRRNAREKFINLDVYVVIIFFILHKNNISFNNKADFFPWKFEIVFSILSYYSCQRPNHSFFFCFISGGLGGYESLKNLYLFLYSSCNSQQTLNSFFFWITAG